MEKVVVRAKNVKLLVLLMVIGLGGLCLPKVANATTDSTVSVDVSPVLTLSSDETVTLSALTPDSSGKQSIASDTVSTTTNDASGVTVTLKDSDTTYTLSSGGSDTIAAATGTYASPVALANGEWGWRVDSLGTFGSGPTAILSNDAPSALTFAAIPANDTPRTIQTTSADGSDSVTVWYSARVNSNQPSGTYTDTVTYTATTN
jgi:hypothetical protein